MVSTVNLMNKVNVAINTMAATQLSGIRSLPRAPGCCKLLGKTVKATLLNKNRVNQRGLY